MESAMLVDIKSKPGLSNGNEDVDSGFVEQECSDKMNSLSLDDALNQRENGIHTNGNNIEERKEDHIKTEEFSRNSSQQLDLSITKSQSTGVTVNSEENRAYALNNLRHASASRDADGDSYLMVVIACDPDYERAALGMIVMSTPAQLNIQNKHGQTAAHVAACVQSINCIRKLIDYGADFTIVDKYGKTPLHIVSERGNTACVLEMFKETQHTDTKTKRMLVKQLVAYDYKGYTPVHYAVANNHIETVKAFCQINVHMNGKVATNGYEAVHLAVEQGNEEMISVLVHNGKANVNAKSFGGVTPLHLAAGYDSLGLVGLLLYLKADVNVKTSENALPVDFAKNIKIIEALRPRQPGKYL